MTVSSHLLQEARRLFRAAEEKRQHADDHERSCRRLREEADRLERRAREAKLAHEAMEQRRGL